MSLRLRLLLALVPLFILGLVVANVGTYKALQSSLLSRVDDQLVSSHRTVEDALVRGFGGGPGGASTAPGTYGELRNPAGSAVLRQAFQRDFGGALDTSTHPVLPSTMPPGTHYFLSVDGSGRVSQYRVYVDTVQDGSGDMVIVAAPLDDVNSTLQRLFYLELGISGGVTVVLIAAIWFIVRRGLRPLERMGQTARSIVASDLSQRITPANEKTEVGRLGLALNTMLSQLDAAFAERAATEQRLRHFVSDASHELRTPLTSMRGYAELLRRNPGMDAEDVLLAMRRVEDEALRMGFLVDDLLLLARLDQGRPLERRPVDLEALVSDAVSDARVADSTRVISSHIAAPLTVVGDDQRLRQAIGNLLRNAIVHTPVRTSVEVELRPENGRAVLEVVDHGPGIPSGHAERIFERFHRAEPGRSRDQGGSGLGLSITAAIVGAHGGSISVHGTPGGGATFRIQLPALVAADSSPEAETPTRPEVG